MQSNIFQNGHGIGVVRPETFSEDTAQTPGSHRVAAITREHGTPSSMWGGLFTVAAGGQTAIHHHGKQDTVVYVLSGTALIRWGRHGELSATAQPGDFVYRRQCQSAGAQRSEDGSVPHGRPAKHFLPGAASPHECDPGRRTGRIRLGSACRGNTLTFGLAIEDRPSTSKDELRAEDILVSPDYFKVMQAPLIRGRFFTKDDEDGKPRVAIIDESTARRFWPDRDPLGRRLRLGQGPWITVVGLVRDIKHVGSTSMVFLTSMFPSISNSMA
jgi:hypothetical protein